MIIVVIIDHRHVQDIIIAEVEVRVDRDERVAMLPVIAMIDDHTHQQVGNHVTNVLMIIPIILHRPLRLRHQRQLQAVLLVPTRVQQAML